MNGLVIALLLAGVLIFGMCLGIAVYVVHGWRKSDGSDESEQDPETARAIDPQNPPKWMTYRPRPGREPINCTCHDRPLVPGDRVLWWPIRDGGGAVDLFCTETVEETLPSSSKPQKRTFGV